MSSLKFVTLSELEHRIELPAHPVGERARKLRGLSIGTAPSYPDLDIQWIEDRFWVWVHYGATKLGRGELFELIDTITHMRGSVLGPIIIKA